jgi:L-seryl-tRNA(Ser) seleniumtransferase
MADQTATLLRELPSIDRLLNNARCATLLTRYNRDYVTQKCRTALDQLRANIRQGKGQLLDDDAILDQVEARIESESRPGHIRVVNATGTILHTNLGRALLSQAAIDAMVAVAATPINLEYDLAAASAASAKRRWSNCWSISPAPKRRPCVSATLPRCCWD